MSSSIGSRRRGEGSFSKLRRMALLAGLLVPLLFAPGCIYWNVTTPLDTDLDETRLGSKVGKASAYSVLWLVAWGDAGTQAAAEDGDIGVIRHADTNTLSILLFLYTRQTTIVYGD
jgi:hypothetical protein